MLPIGEFQHPCEGDLIIKSTSDKVSLSRISTPAAVCAQFTPALLGVRQIPYFNAPIYLENITQVGKVDEIFGTIQEVYFSVKPSEGVTATSFKPGDKLFISPDKLLPLQRFLTPPKGVGGKGKGKGDGKGKGKGKGMGKGKGKGDGKGKGKGMSPGGKGKGGRGKGF